MTQSTRTRDEDFDAICEIADQADAEMSEEARRELCNLHRNEKFDYWVGRGWMYSPNDCLSILLSIGMRQKTGIALEKMSLLHMMICFLLDEPSNRIRFIAQERRMLEALLSDEPTEEFACVMRAARDALALALHAMRGSRVRH
jgi:hypothetical protein